MEFEDYLNVMIWMDVRVCFPFTLLAIGLCWMVHFDNNPVTYYLNLLVANVIQLITLIVLVTKLEHSLNFTFLLIYGSVAMVSLYFRMIIALERCFFISWPQLHFIRQTKGSVIICVLGWVICLVVFSPLIVFGQIYVVFVFAFILSLVFIFCPIGTFISLPGATLVSAEGKRRIVGTFVILLINYVVTIVTPICLYVSSYFHHYLPHDTHCLFTLLLSPFMDLFLFVFMREGPIDKLLSCLCCCKMETSAGDDGSRLSI